MTAAERRHVVRLLRATARRIEMGKLDNGICGTAGAVERGGYVIANAAVGPYLCDMSGYSLDGSPLCAYAYAGGYDEPEARALAAYLIALQIESEGAE